MLVSSIEDELIKYGYAVRFSSEYRDLSNLISINLNSGNMYNLPMIYVCEFMKNECIDCPLDTDTPCHIKFSEYIRSRYGI
jgi:hypothetical protein